MRKMIYEELVQDPTANKDKASASVKTCHSQPLSRESFLNKSELPFPFVNSAELKMSNTNLN